MVSWSLARSPRSSVDEPREAASDCSAGQCLDLSSRNRDDEDEALARRARDRVRWRVALSLDGIRSAARRNVGDLHEHEQPANSAVSAFCSSSQSNHKRYWKAHNSALSGIKPRMHARRTRDRWPHYWPDRPLRPIDGQTGSHVSRDAGLPSLTRRNTRRSCPRCR